MRKIAATGTIAFMIMVVLTLAGAQKIKVVDGVTVISNGKKPSPPPGQPATLKLIEELTVGQSDNPDEALSEVGTIVVSKEGNIFALDSRDKKIKVFDSRGKYLRSIGKPGQGPGEVDMPSGIQMTAGGELLVEDAGTRRFSFFKPSGEFLKHVSFADKMGLVNVAMDAQGNFLGRELGFSENTMYFEIKKFDPQLKPLFTLDKIEFNLPVPGSGKKINLMDLICIYQFDGAGNIFYGRNVNYEIQVFNPEGKHIRSIQKEYDRVKITQEDIDDIIKRVGSAAAVGGVNVKELFEFPEYFPPFQFFVVDEKGWMLVRTNKKGKVKDEYEVDVFNAEGRFIAQFLSRADLRVWQGGKLYGIEVSEEGFSLIKRYTLSAATLP